ncbi:MAG: TetR/AcrR family transcriptional regulator, partial [Spirochaetota bacterium]
MAKRRYSSEADPTRARILRAALGCISGTAAGVLSVRTIAAAAEVNVATVHYYFGTKDAVLTEALELFFAPLVERLDALLERSGSGRDRLEGFLLFYVGLIQEHPGIFTSIIEAMIASNIRGEPGAPSAYEKVLMGIIGIGKGRLMGLIRDLSGIADETVLALRTLQLMTSVIHPMLISTIPQDQFGIDFHDPATRGRYVRLLVDSIAGGSGGLSASRT